MSNAIVDLSIRLARVEEERYQLAVKVLTFADANKHSDEIATRLAAENARLREALQAMLIVSDKGDKPKKLDDALTWRENDERAREMALAALNGGLPPTQPTADAGDASSSAVHGVMDNDDGRTS